MRDRYESSKINVNLTQMVINLHAIGYVFDFRDFDSQFVCLQDNRSFPAGDVQISIAGRYYDQLSKSFKYIYAIDTNSGMKGLMLSNKSLSEKLAPKNLYVLA